MNYSKPQILIDLDEYNHLKAIEEKDKLFIGDLTTYEVSDAVSELIYVTFNNKQIPRELVSGRVLVNINEDKARKNNRIITFRSIGPIK